MSFRLHCADALVLMRSLPKESVDLIDTDVAYESLEKHRAVGTTTRLKQSDASSNEWFEIFRNDQFPAFFGEAYRILKKNTHLYFFCDGETSRVAIPLAEAAGFTFWNEIVWVKTKPKSGNVSAERMERSDLKIGMGYHYRKTKEFVLFFEKGKRKVNDLGVPDVLPFPRVDNGYPTEKPVELHKVLISQSTEPGEIVFDPFMGSGSAGNAAVRLGRSFLGGDLKESAVEIARKTLVGAGAKEDLDLIPPRGDEPDPPPKKTRVKKPPTAEDRATMAEAGGTTEAELPMGAAEASRDIRETGEAESKQTEPKYRAFAFSNGKVQGEVPNVMFETKVSDEPLPALEAPGLVAQLAETFGEVEREFLAEPKLDGVFATGPLPGGPTGHLPAVDVVPPARPPSCQHGELRSACILCRARR